MKRQISLAQYRAVDLTILTGLMMLSQALICWAVGFWHAEATGYIVSPVAAVTALVMMRWDLWAAVPAGIGGALLAVLCGGDAKQVLIYTVGNLAAMPVFLFLKTAGKERVRTNVVLALLFGLLTQLLMQLGRAAVAALLGYPWLACWDFITTDAMSVLFTLVIVWVVRRVEGLFEDQKHYLLRIERERSEKGGEQL